MTPVGLQCTRHSNAKKKKLGPNGQASVRETGKYREDTQANLAAKCEPDKAGSHQSGTNKESTGGSRVPRTRQLSVCGVPNVPKII